MDGVWPDGLFDAYVTMIPKSDGDCTPLGQRPLCVLPVVYRIWASVRLRHLDDWLRSWLPPSVFSAGSGRRSVEAWKTSGLDIEEVLTGATDSDVHLFVADVVKYGWLPILPEVHLPRLTGQMLADVVLRKGVSAGSLDGWGWRELKALPVSWFDELARILVKVEDLGVWPDGLLDAYIAMIPKTDGDATPLGQRPLCVLPVVYRVWAAARMSQLEGWFKSWVPDSVFSAGGGRGSVEAWYTSALDIEEVLSGATDSHVHLFVADVVKSFDTVDRGILDRVLSSLGLPGWFRHAYFEYHAHVRLRFKLASGLGQSWTRDGGIPQGCP